jgi:hypothetical protein
MSTDSFTPSPRKAVQLDLELRRKIRVESRALKARLAELSQRALHFTDASIAKRHGVSLQTVHSLATRMPWTEDEKPPQGPLRPYDPRK